MSNEKNFFREDAFGDMYEDSFLADEFPKRPPENKIDNNAEAAEISAATARVRLTNEVDAGQEATKAMSSAYNLGGALGGNGSNNFSGNIFGGI